MITRYGIGNFIFFVIISLLLILTIIWVDITALFYVSFFLGILLFVFSFVFFRDPKREIDEKIRSDNSMILSPADGRIVEIIQEAEPIFLKQKAYRISIFLSPLDVHINRIPMNGKVAYLKYIKGRFFAAYKPKASLKNEQTHIGLVNDLGRILFKQIVGVAARRLVCELKEGDDVVIGSKFGMMKFGSRIDLFLPNEFEIFVKISDRVIAGKTIIAKFKNSL